MDLFIERDATNICTLVKILMKDTLIRVNQTHILLWIQVSIFAMS